MNHAALFSAVFIALFVGHHLGDHVAQTDWQAARKHGSGWAAARAMIGHLFNYHLCIGAALLGLVVIDVPLRPAGIVVALIWSVLTHGFIDRRWPVRVLLQRGRSPLFAESTSSGVNGIYLADQSLHIGCLFVGALLVSALS
ncbi:Protein of unknown function (DUF3307) [Parafrankia irregularis]|uniref:DUF3307 domain-containing protein n=1 Tax=Parafrankia irregularis TaxID=795642 RepID=A0A0S4QT39_9ACTN|nr:MULTISPECIES: DUF3307 domain-containing protein [Parafrankia]MBE3204631.1 DUF3307 domain-containing protein [Parafrankia sp. CH37]CUU58484.1 Protein of unknown function (DUF3307) [Parafrankia irregularis]